MIVPSGAPVVHIAPLIAELVAMAWIEQNLARAEGFKRMAEAAGQEWPDGWVKGEGFVRPRSTDDPMKPPPTVAEVGEEHIRQIVDISPGHGYGSPQSARSSQ